jgi:chromosome segregation ATPase
MFGDGRLTHLPGGVDEYLARLDGSLAPDAAPGSMTGDLSPERDRSAQSTGAGAADQRAAKKELARLERQIAKLDQREAQLHEQMATHATDYEKVSTLDAELRGVLAERSGAEEAWLELADRVGGG